jgi:peptide-methionine (S)-S-oxide reductase
VGYAGGTKKNPTYHNLGDHTETIEIDYDPNRISYEQLLEVFWRSHDPTQRSWSRQYMAAVFYHNEDQKRRALETRERVQARFHTAVATQIVPGTEFYPAEAYHQKYKLRQAPDLMDEFTRIYPNNADFVNSTAAARVNGYLYGYGSAEDVDAAADRLGLSPNATKKLRDLVKNRHSGSRVLERLRLHL